MKHSLPTFVFASFLLGSATFAVAADPPPDALFASAAETKGDFDTWVNELTDALVASPDSAYAPLCIDRVRGLLMYSTDPDSVDERLESALAAGVSDPETREKLTDFVAARRRAKGDFDGARELGGEPGYLRRFATIGPFGWTGDALVHRRFAPEDGWIDPTVSVSAKKGKLDWLALPEIDDSPWIAPYSQLRSGGSGVTYSLCRLESRDARSVAFKVWCNGSLKVLVNGAEIVAVDRQRDQVSNPVWCTARLAAGVNQIVVKLVDRQSFALKVCDVDTGEPITDLEVADPLGTSERIPADATRPVRKYRSPTERAVALADDGGATRFAAAAQLLGADGLDWQSYAMWEQAVAATTLLPATEKANVLAAHGRFITDFRQLPDVERKLRSKDDYKAALEAVSHHQSATVRLARYDDEDDRPNKAVAALQKYIATNPTAFAFMELANIASRRDWEREAIESAEAALAIAPNHAPAIRFLAGYDEKRKDHASHEQRMLRLLELDAADTGAYGSVMKHLQDRGESEQSLAMLDQAIARWPNALNYQSQKAATLRTMGRIDEALAIWRDLWTKVPQEQRYPLEIGEIHEVNGDIEGAIEHYEQALALRGYQPKLWRVIRRLKDEPEDFAAAHEPDVEKLLADLPSDEELRKRYPKAVAITVLDHSVVKIRPDGSATSFVHMVYKLLDENGVQKYHDVSNVGDLYEIRTILPDGTVMAPTGLRRRNYNMEGLVPGSIIQHRYMAHQQAGDEGFDGGEFYFQDFDFRNNPNPVLLTRYVVLAPEDMKLTPRKRNFEGEPAVTSTGDGFVATTWEKRDMPRIEWEQSMPRREEIVPHVVYSPDPSMEDAAWRFLGGRENSKGSSILAEILDGIVTDGMGDTAKMHAIYDWVNREITGDFGGGNNATSIVLEKAGDRGQVFQALIRLAGIQYRLGRAMPWRGSGRDLKVPTPSLFSGRFLWLEPRDSEPVPFFAGARHAPFGLVPAAYRGSFAFLVSESGGELMVLPEGGPRVDNGASFLIHLGAGPEDTKLSGTIAFRSPGGYRWKRQLEETPQDDRRKFAEGQFANYFTSPSLEEFEFPGLMRGEPMRVHVRGTVSQYLSKQGKAFVASLGLPKTNMTGRFVQRPEREYDLVLNVRDNGVDEIEIHVSDAFEVVSLPDDHLAVSALGTYSLTWRRDGDSIRIRRERHLQPARYTPEEYKAFVGWCKAIDDAEERKIEFRQR